MTVCGHPRSYGLPENPAYNIEPDEKVICAICEATEYASSEYRYRLHGRGEAFLCGPSHSPHNAEANYICKDHLDKDAVIMGDVRP